MTARKTKVGDVVLVTVDARMNNGSDEAAAVVTRVLDAGDDENRVNLKVLLDGDENLLLRNVVLENRRPKEPKEGEEPLPKHVAFSA